MGWYDPRRSPLISQRMLEETRGGYENAGVGTFGDVYRSGRHFFGEQASRGPLVDIGRGHAPWPLEAGPHRGQGPRGWSRSDDRILEDVCARLGHDGWVDASDMTVHVEGGEVTLDGTVTDRRQKRRAEDIVDGVAGVVDVHNHLRIPRVQEPEAVRQNR